MSKDLSPKQAARKEREERLAAELRENLKRRKAQARARKAPEAPGIGKLGIARAAPDLIELVGIPKSGVW